MYVRCAILGRAVHGCAHSQCAVCFCCGLDSLGGPPWPAEQEQFEDVVVALGENSVQNTMHGFLPNVGGESLQP